MKAGDEYVSLGQVASGPTWDSGVMKLQYTSGQLCPDKTRNRSSIIRFKCDKDKVVRPTVGYLSLKHAGLNAAFTRSLATIHL